MKTPTTSPTTPAAQATPTPWSIQERADGLGSLVNRNSLEIVHNYLPAGGQQVIVGKHTGIDCLTPANAALIVESVNSHAGLVARVAELTHALDRTAGRLETVLRYHAAKGSINCAVPIDVMIATHPDLVAARATLKGGAKSSKPRPYLPLIDEVCEQAAQGA
jgi:hypothetical protein